MSSKSFGNSTQIVNPETKHFALLGWCNFVHFVHYEFVKNTCILSLFVVFLIQIKNNNNLTKRRIDYEKTETVQNMGGSKSTG